LAAPLNFWAFQSPTRTQLLPAKPKPLLNTNDLCTPEGIQNKGGHEGQVAGSQPLVHAEVLKKAAYSNPLDLLQPPRKSKMKKQGEALFSLHKANLS